MGILYGSDINSLQTLKKDGISFPATYIIYKNNAYYMITKESSTEKVVVYKTSNLTSFEEIVIRRESSEERNKSGSTITYCTGALLLTSDNRIAMLYSKTEGDGQPCIRFILCDTFDSFDHVGNNFIEFNEYLEYDCNKNPMDYSSIIVGVLALAGTLMGSLISNNKTQALVIYRLQQIEDKVNKHNNLVERMYNLEEKQMVMEEQIKVANHRITDLEEE